MTTGKKIAIILAVFVAMDLVAIAYIVRNTGSSAEAAQAALVDAADLPVLYPAPEISLTDNHGKPWTSAAMAGKIWIVDFFFTSCAGPCPIMTAQMASVSQDTLTEDLHFVSVSVDPETDTPERLTEFGEKYGADFGRWHFLTGDITHIADLAYNGFKLGHKDDPIFHSERFVLVDREGNIRGYYTGTDREDVMKLRTHLEALLREPAS